MNRNTANLLGIICLALWSMNVAVTRHVSEAHVFGMPALSFTVAGLTLILFDTLRGKGNPWKANANPKFWLLGGSAFVAYVVLYVAALAWSETRVVALTLGLVNYCWPALILLLMPAFFPCRVNWGVLGIGLAMCLAGVASALLWGMNKQEVLRGLAANWLAFLMMGAAAFLWAFYSNAARKWAGDASGTGWFQLAAGVIFLLLWAETGGELGFSLDMLPVFLLHAMLVNAAAYLLWDFGVRWGDLGLLGTLANFLPLGSVLFGAWYLGSGLTLGLGVGCVLVTAGAALSRKGLGGGKE